MDTGSLIMRHSAYLQFGGNEQTRHAQKLQLRPGYPGFQGQIAVHVIACHVKGFTAEDELLAHLAYNIRRRYPSVHTSTIRAR